MDDNVSLISGVADRYATALFELCVESGAVERLEADCLALRDAIKVSDDLASLLASPVYRDEEMGQAMRRIAERLDLSEHVRNALALMVRRRRLFAVAAMIEAVMQRIADARGVTHANVKSAHPLNAEQMRTLDRMLRDALGRTVEIELEIDPSLIGGLIVGIGSRIVDGSVKSQLSRLETVMKEVS